MLCFTCYVGSKCYEFYIYSQNHHSEEDWKKKLSTALHSDYVSEDMQRGTDVEPFSLKVFDETTPGTLFKGGLIINKYLPCFGYSPDVLILHNDELELVETKCPRPQESEKELITHCKRFLVRNKSGKLELRQKCPYYGQVQFGMFLTNTRKCHFLVHHKTESKNIEIIVDYNAEFVRKMLKNLVSVYFYHYLPYLQTYYRY